MEVVYGAHEFEAENQDEISFKAGERIIVLEKDDQYHDGWWQGENESGQRGLFPQNYTVQTKPILSEPSSPLTTEVGTFQSSNGAPLAAGAAATSSSASGQRGGLEPGVSDITRKDSQNGPPEMRATINDIQNHLDEMHLNSNSANGTIAPANGASAPPPPTISRNVSIDETSSLASRSTRDDASSIREQDHDFDTQRHTTGTAGAAGALAKENLARNIQLAQEKEQRKRLEEERLREAEREQMRLSGGPPVEGLVLTDESDIEEDEDDDDDSIFPARKRASDDLAAPSRGMEEEEDVRVPTPAQDQTPLVGAKQSGRFSPAPTGPTTPPLPAATSSNTIIEQDEDSTYPTPATEEPRPPLDQGVLSGGRSTPALVTPAVDMPGALPMARSDTAKQAEQVSEPSLAPQQGDSSRRASVESEQFIVSKRDTPVDMSSPESSPIATSAQQFTRGAPASRYSTDAAAPPNQDSLLTIVEHAQAQPPLTLNPPRQSTTSSQSAATPVSPYQSTAGSSRPSSTLGTAFTPGTSAGHEPSPRSATFPARTPTLSDPKEWTVEQVLEWGQGKNFEAHVLGKFREHEISGDVLVEMDINTLKEIDIIAFGPRARIARAIKELNAKYYGVPILSPSASSYMTDLPTTPESHTAPGSAQYAQSGFPPSSSAATPSQSYQASPVTASGPAVGHADHLRGLGLAEASPAQSSGTASSAAGSTRGSTKPSSLVRSNTSRTRQTTDDSFEAANEGQDAESRAPSSAETQAASVPMNERRRQKSSIGSTVSGAFGRHSRTKSVAPSVAESANGSVQESGDKGKSGRAFFGGTLSRSRKPPPQYQASDVETLANEKSAAPVPRSPPTAPSGNRLSTRFFTFGGGAPASPPSGSDRPRRNISAPLEVTSPKTAESKASPTFETRSPPAAPSTGASQMHAEPQSYVTTAEQPASAAAPAKALTQAERIGEPDYSGWLRKKTDKYNGWKDRYLILKDSYLYVLKTPTEDKVKGYISLAGYRFVSDGSVGSGLSDKSKYGFKAIHDTLPTHYFSSSDSVVIRNWMKALMKATIGRDYSAPVTSSSNIKTIPLSVAQAMNPPPRPPSPTSAIRVQKASVKQNPNSLSQQDAAKLMGAQVITPSPSGMIRSGSNTGLATDKKSSPVSPTKKKTNSLLPPLRSSQRKKPMAETSSTMARSPSSGTRPSMSSMDDGRRNSWYEKASDRQAQSSPRESFGTARQQFLSPQDAEVPAAAAPANRSQDVLDWLNNQLPADVDRAYSWQDLCSGKIYTRVVERLSGKSAGISDAQFAQFTPLQPGRTPDMSYVDVLFNCFDFLLDSNIKTEDVSINDLLTGNEPHLIKLAEIIRDHFES
ncbi:hypothetical protein P389DRAFT_57275 [Cystobasidium minutum MCA 4210]|uniref:uncharacterized protein n=1 Tax=Cystobasidium minutum MCA 4210 TaxID=1397322 RepID=UPI0034CD0A7F|eukprot:jgi/Rhomi1/57275/CE57274_3392